MSSHALDAQAPPSAAATRVWPAPDGARGFACPYEPWSNTLLEEIVSEYARSYVALFAERFGPTLDSRGEGLRQLLEAWASAGSSFDVSWDTTLGAVRGAVLGRGQDVPRAAAALALHLHLAAGVNGSWRLRLSRRERLRTGQWLLPAADELAVDAHNGFVTVELWLSSERVDLMTLDRLGPGAAPPGCEVYPEFSIAGSRVRLVRGEALSELATPLDPADRPALADEGVVELCAQAVNVLVEYAPPYVAWVRRVLRGVVPLNGSAGCMRSSSEESRPGVITLSFPHAPIALAEAFVHEATHQYYDALQRLSAAVDDTDRKLYYSSVKNAMRPLDGILVAAHAFANVVLFYRECQRNGLAAADVYCREMRQRHEDDLRGLFENLRDNPAMTPIGRALWQPLEHRIANP